MSTHPILVVDDDAGILEIVSAILAIEGYEVETATDGERALESLQHTEPSLILLDMRMPVLDGWGFVRRLEELGRKLPIVVMTAARDAGQWAEEVGAVGYIAKPFDMRVLLETVGQYTSPAA